MGDVDYEIGGEGPSRDARMWAMWCHLGALVGYILIPFGSILAPAVIWLMKRESDPFIDAHGREALNFQVTLLMYFVVAAILILVVVGLVLLPILYIGGVILTIHAAIHANDGRPYRYPFTIRMFN